MFFHVSWTKQQLFQFISHAGRDFEEWDLGQNIYVNAAFVIYNIMMKINDVTPNGSTIEAGLRAHIARSPKMSFSLRAQLFSMILDMRKIQETFGMKYLRYVERNLLLCISYFVVMRWQFNVSVAVVEVKRS